MIKEDVQIIRLGAERQPLVVLDNFSECPNDLIADAAAKEFFAGGKHYPGIRAQADFAYLSMRSQLLERIFKEIFGCANGIEITESNYSLVTTPEADLRPIQSLPHFDGFDPGRFAILHYLCDVGHGGTAFYRHKATGYETVSQSQFADYEQTLQNEVSVDGVPKGYFRGSHRFERTHLVEARMDRLVIYRGTLLHSGYIPSNSNFSTDPHTGRLSINIFCNQV